LAAAIWGKLHSRTNVLMTDSTACDCPRSAWKEKLKALLTMALFHKAFVSGRRAARYTRSISHRSFVRESGYDVVDNGFFAERAAEIRARTGTNHGGGPFLFVGRLIAQKNLPLLLRAFQEYRRMGGTRCLEIVGDGPQNEELQKTDVRSALGDAVLFRGHRSHRDLPEDYARACCLILPSVSESWGLVVNEAMAAGLPVIVSDRCGCAEDLVEDAKNGFVFPAQNAGALAERMQRIDNLRPAEWRTMARRSEEIVARFSPEAWADAVVRMAREGTSCQVVA